MSLHRVTLYDHKGFEGPMVKPGKSIDPLGSLSDFLFSMYPLGLDDLFINFVGKVN